MNSQDLKGLPAGGRILLPGVPGVTDRGYLGYCTVFLFQLEGEWALFDTGHYSDRHLLLKALEGAGLGPDEVRHVVLSHLHFDHSLNLSLFERAVVYLARSELEYAENVTAGALNDPSLPDFWPWLLKDRSIRYVEDELALSDTMRLKVFPGHTPGCLVLFLQGPETTAVCGDVIKNGWEAKTGRHGMALVGAESADAGIKAVLEQARIIIPGHDRPFKQTPAGPRYLSPLSWKVRGNFYPRPADEILLTVDLPADIDGLHEETTTHTT